MNARERMLAAINHQPVDRVPTDIWCTQEVVQQLSAHFGSFDTAREALHIDGFATPGPMPYIGPAVPCGTHGESFDFWGIGMKTVPYETGTYEEQSRVPLADAGSIDDLERYAWPSANWFDYSHMRAGAEVARQTHVVQWGYMAPFYYHNLLRGLEQSLVDPYDDPDFTHHLLGRITDFFYEHHRRIFEACDGLIDVAQVTDDFGSQTGLLISLETFRAYYKPHMQRLIDLCHEFGIKVFHHDDGAMRPILPDLLDMGDRYPDPVQWNCAGMDLPALKQEFGQKICFHGAVENQRILPFLARRKYAPRCGRTLISWPRMAPAIFSRRAITCSPSRRSTISSPCTTRRISTGDSFRAAKNKCPILTPDAWS